VFLAILLLFISQLHRSLEEYSGVEVNFKTPYVLRPDDLTLLRQSTQKSFETVDATLEDSSDESEDASHESVVHSLTHPAIKMLEEYKFHHSQHQLEADLENCRERANVDKRDSIHDVIAKGWCPEFQDRKYLVVKANCKSPETLREYLRNISWAIATDRALLWKDSHGTTGSCKGLLAKSDWIPTYDQWNQELSLGKIQTVDIQDIDPHNEDTGTTTGTTTGTSRKVIRLRNPPSLHHQHLKQSASRRKADQLLSDSMLYGILLEEALDFDPTIIPKKTKNNSQESSKEKVNSYVIQTVGNDKRMPMPDCMQGVVKSPCVVYQIGEGSIQPMLDDNTCVIHQVGPETGKTFVETLALAAQARNGVMLPQKHPLSNLLKQLIAYRGRMDNHHIQMKTCLYSSGNKHHLRN
jgi:hypothetical protein